MTSRKPHPDCASRKRPHGPHELLAPGGGKPGASCDGMWPNNWDTGPLRSFPDPGPLGDTPLIVYLETHEHEWTEVGANLHPNGTWSQVYACWCGSVGQRMDHVGPVPVGWCPCGWVNDVTGKRTRCSECREPIDPANWLAA